MIFAVTGCVFIFGFVSLVAIHIGITSSAIGLKIWVINTGIQKYRSIIKQKKKHDKILSLAKYELRIIENLISNALIDSNISHNEFVFIHNASKEFDDMKWKIKKSNVK